MKEQIRDILLRSGAVACRFARAEALPSDVRTHYSRWLKEGNNADMAWMLAREELHADPRQLLEDCRTIASLAFPYRQREVRRDVSVYAYGEDYHNVVRKRLKNLCKEIGQTYGCKTRICVDSAPVAERYWAEKSGVGFRAENGAIIVPGYGSQVFLAEVLISLDIEPDEASHTTCLQCGACVKACPGRALLGDGKVDARRCVSYLTIEHEGEFDESQRDIVHRSGMLFGCDVCQKVCPHNADAPFTALKEFLPGELILTLDTAELPEQISGKYPMHRTGLIGLRRNAEALLKRICEP